MWYLQGDTLIIISVISFAVALLRKKQTVFNRKIPINIILPVIELAALSYISLRLAVFYTVYIGLGLLFCDILHSVRHKRFLFVLFCIFAAVPLFVSRTDSFGIKLPFLFVSIGIAFGMLKLIDSFYYVYYAGEPVAPLVFINYMLFLPVFTAGPIFRYRDFSATYTSPLTLNADEFTSCIKRLIRGLFKKVVLAEPVLLLFDRLRTSGQHWYISFSVVVISYTVLYLDLSGYSDIAIAFGRIAGFDVPENFKKPLISPSFTQFWRNWHATLSDWIREHVFIIFSKKRPGKRVSALIALLTMILMSLWHGFNLPYLLAGIYNGLLLMAENLLSLTTVNRHKTKKSVFVLRCFAVNFLFGLNTLVFTLPAGEITAVLRGFLTI